MRGAVGVTLASIICATAVAMSAATVASAAHATASAKSSPQGDTWASIATLPDWSGVWDFDYRSGGGLARPAPPHLTPAAQKKFDAYREAQKHGEEQQTSTANCVPPGMPQIMQQPYPVEFLFTPGKVTVAIEAYSQMRRIFTDGRKLPEDPDPSFQGYSVGHWEGDTLVVETVGLLDNSSLAPGVGHSDQARILERIRRISPETLEIQQTITDPKTITEPWVSVHRYQRHKEWDIKEYICDQNNRDSADEKGRAGLDIEKR